MLTLAIETSTRRASVALQVDGQPALVAELSGEAPRVRDLMPLAQALFKQSGAIPRDLTHVLVGTGPGSYTGLRIGVALALGLAIGPNPPILLGVPSCDALLWRRLQAEAESAHATWLSDARAGTWYHSSATNSSGFAVTSPAALIPANAIESSLSGNSLLYTDEASLENLTPLLASRAVEVFEPNAKDILGLGIERLGAGVSPTLPGELAPLYLREFAAKVRSR